MEKIQHISLLEPIIEEQKQEDILNFQAGEEEKHELTPMKRLNSGESQFIPNEFRRAEAHSFTS